MFAMFHIFTSKEDKADEWVICCLSVFRMHFVPNQNRDLFNIFFILRRMCDLRQLYGLLSTSVPFWESEPNLCHT